MKRNGFKSVCRNKHKKKGCLAKTKKHRRNNRGGTHKKGSKRRRTMQTGGGHIELIRAILGGNLDAVRANIGGIDLAKKNAIFQPQLQCTVTAGKRLRKTVEDSAGNAAVVNVGDKFEVTELKTSKSGMVFAKIPGGYIQAAYLDPNPSEYQFAIGRTALYLACRSPIPNPKIVTLLLDNEFSPNSRNNDDLALGAGAYPLHGVVQSTKETLNNDQAPNFDDILKIIQLLTVRGANLSAINIHGLTALDEYGSYVKPTTQKFFPEIDIQLHNALKPHPPPGYGAPPPSTYHPPPSTYHHPPPSSPPGYGAPPPPPLIGAPTWFSNIFGFNEVADHKDNFGLVKRNVSIRSVDFENDMDINILTLTHTGQQFWAGKFTMNTIPELEVSVTSKTLRYTEMNGDVKLFHEDPILAGSVFQVASQFNALEMSAPENTPNMGITIYQHDRTQGPVCAMACPAGTLFRNYFVNDRGQDTPEHQLDGLKDAHKLLRQYNHNAPLWEMQNGYCRPINAAALSTVCNLLQPGTPLRRQFMDSIRYGVQWDTQVIPSKMPYTTLDKCHKVTQVYCSALPIAYSKYSADEWANFATAVLDAAYEATLAVGAVLCDQRKSARVKVFLTSVGGGVFGNDDRWIKESIGKACAKFANYPLDVILINFKGGQSYHPIP